MSGNIGFALALTGLAVLGFGTFRNGWRLTGFDIAGDLLSVAGWALRHNWALTALWVAVTAVQLWMMRRNRRRTRAARELGAKSRARLAALVAKVRESATPRPVLRPVPGGAR